MTIDDQSAADKEITSLFDIAREKLKKIDVNAKQQKKEVIKELAKSLEGKIPTETIAIEIKHKLRGEVSERYIDKCLDEKNKHKHRVQNAKKQKKTDEPQSINDKDLAAPIPLEPEKKQKEEIIVVNSGGQVLLHKDREGDNRGK